MKDLFMDVVELRKLSPNNRENLGKRDRRVKRVKSIILAFNLSCLIGKSSFNTKSEKLIIIL